MSTLLGICIHSSTMMIHMKGGHAPGSFWVKNLEKDMILSLWTQLFLEFTSDVHQTWYMYSSKYKDDPLEKGVRLRGHFGLKT